ncbi:MAG TPA: amidohydrolase family protein [Acidimicrobiales bacterium]
MDEKVVIVSCDSHAGVPKELWKEYLPERFHDLLPQLRQDNVVYPMAIYLITARNGAEGLEEHQIAHQEDWHGLHDPVIRLADMDREGVAAELIYLGDSRLGDMFHNVSGRDYGLEAWEAGAKGWNRWAADAFGFAMDRFLVTGAIGPCVDMDATVAELHWIADHDFTAMYLPGYMKHADMPPLYDPYWEPFWTACEERGTAVVVHAGYGTQIGGAFPQIEKMYNDVAAVSPSEERDDMLAHADAIDQSSLDFFFEFLNKNIDSRQPLWQMTLGGVFDRHPNLKLMLSEIRLDWIPAALAHLDKIFEENRGVVPAKRKPSEYWQTNCLAGASFIHKAEVEKRHEVGIDTILFGRDFPHPESTWPHTKEWLRDAFAGVPEDEAKKMVGLNGVRFFDLDGDRLADIAKRIGPTIEELVGGGEVRPELLENFGLRGGYYKPWEGDDRVPLLDEALKPDLAEMGRRA